MSDEILSKLLRQPCDDTVSGKFNYSIPAKTSDLVNDSNFVIDASYIHTDNNFTDDMETKLNQQSGINTGDQDLSGLVSKVTTVNGHALSSNVTLTKADIGLGNVDNTSDINKPVSNAVQTVLNTKTSVSSGSGAPSSPPAKAGDIYIDTTNYKTYVSKGTSSSSDWILQASSVLESKHYIGSSGQPTFQGTWVNYSINNTENAHFYKDNQGIVHLGGAIKSGTLNTVAFNLPSGYYDTYSRYYAVPSTGGFSQIVVQANGAVVPVVGTPSAYIALDGITFRV